MARTEDRFGELKALGSTYTIIGAAVPSSTKWVTTINVTNRTSGNVSLQLFVADSSWSSGEPSGSTLKYAIAYNTLILPGEVQQFTGNVVLTTEKVVAYSSVSSGLDIGLGGVAVT